MASSCREWEHPSYFCDSPYLDECKVFSTVTISTVTKRRRLESLSGPSNAGYMLIVKRRPWTEIAELYRSLSEQHVAFRSMQNLVEQISASKYATGLFAATSMHTLLIAQTPEFDWDEEILRVSLDVHTRALVFDFQETGSNLPKYQHWIRRCPPEEGFSRLERFLALKKWFVEYRS
jgi:hypothetical protein